MMPRAFVVHATDRDGNPVAMVITPNSLTALTTTPQQNAAGQNGNGVAQNYDNNNSGPNSSGTMGNNGMNNSDQSGSSVNSSNGNGTYSR